MPETETIDVGEIDYAVDAIEAIDLSCGDYELGDGIELSVLASDGQGKLKFEFEKVYGRIREPFVIGEEAWRCLVRHSREIDVCLLRRTHELFELSDDATLATCCTPSGDRLVRLRVSAKNARASTFELTHAAWAHLSDKATQISRDADMLRRY
jgi:hypothetical protein